MRLRDVAVSLAIACVGCTATASVHGGMTVVYSQPPQPKVETMAPRPGYVWVRGHWDLVNGQWAWISGRYVRDRPGSRWQEGRWERRGEAWHWFEGEWVAGGSVVGQVSVGTEYPTEAPPSPRVEDTGPSRPHQFWIGGHWQWKDRTWSWVPGHWEPEREGSVWSPGRWERQGANWVWIDGTWGSGGVVVGGGGDVVVTSEDPTEEPPPPQAESYGTNRGHVWIPGHWEWKAGKWAWLGGRWEKERPKQAWSPGKWERRGNRWVWIEGRWTNR